MTGTARVKWYSEGKGYGWATLPDGASVFIHHEIVPRPLNAGERVYLQFIQRDDGTLRYEAISCLLDKVPPGM